MHKTPTGKRSSSGLQEVRVVGVTMRPSENSRHGHGSRLTNLGRTQNYRDANALKRKKILFCHWRFRVIVESSKIALNFFAAQAYETYEIFKTGIDTFVYIVAHPQFEVVAKWNARHLASRPTAHVFAERTFLQSRSTWHFCFFQCSTMLSTSIYSMLKRTESAARLVLPTCGLKFLSESIFIGRTLGLNVEWI